MKRRHIPLKTKLAAALACLLPQEERDWYRRRNSHADEIIKLFQFDHVALHSLGGSDLWWNLDPKSKAAHREKSRRDTAIVAKVKRLILQEHRENWLPKKGKRKWPSRKLKSNPFPKRKRLTYRGDT